ncbi:MAG: acyltransferase family protein [Aliidongia sp.]
MSAIAILLVILFHMPSGAVPDFLLPVQPFGWMGVDLFFVLSGYLIGTQLFRHYARTGQLAIGRFYTARAFRILPGFLAVGLAAASRRGASIPAAARSLACAYLQSVASAVCRLPVRGRGDGPNAG